MKAEAIEAARSRADLQGLIDLAAGDGRIDRGEVTQLYQLGAAAGIRSRACDPLVAEYLKDHEGETDGNY